MKITCHIYPDRWVGLYYDFIANPDRSVGLFCSSLSTVEPGRVAVTIMHVVLHNTCDTYMLWMQRWIHVMDADAYVTIHVIDEMMQPWSLWTIQTRFLHKLRIKLESHSNSHPIHPRWQAETSTVIIVDHSNQQTIQFNSIPFNSHGNNNKSKEMERHSICSHYSSIPTALINFIIIVTNFGSQLTKQVPIFLPKS